ncbi:uncharacterized protein LOC141763315 [Sebastes fasciatus]|uniref:uncharacterized protein LOC141763315 n=1 Tax=Sebastes fasciatus TaxID=394691 RepID=UPI003D9E86FE
MADRAVLHFLCVLGVFQKGLTALIETQHTVEAAVGDEASLTCHLMQPRDVLQVTWQKILPEGEKNMATYSERFGERVHAGFQSKLQFKDAGLQNSSIVIRRVMEEDEGCYRCMFNTFSEGALIATTCLQLYELHGPFLHVRESTVVSCSATARPAPTVTLTVPHYNSTSVTNTNGTVTVTTTAELSGLHGNSTQVGCAVRVLSGPQIEVSMMIPEVKQLSAHDFILIIVFVVYVCFVAAVVTTLLVRKHRNRRSDKDSEENKTPQQAIKDTPEFKTPLMKEENELRLQTSTEKDKNRLTALIETQHTVEAAVGDEACLNCCLMQPRDVLQVTWQKVLPEGEKNMATYSERFGERVLAGFQSKLEFRDAGLQNTSIVIRRVMEEDEGCYRCMFNTFSEGALIATTCLQLYELHGPFLHVIESTGVSCSATARPAPTVTLTVPHYNSTSVTNTNGTVTVTSTAGLSGLHGNSTQVGCAVRVLSGPQIEVSMMIPEVKQSSDDGFDEESGSNNFILIIVLFVVCVCVAAVVITLLIRKHRNRFKTLNEGRERAAATDVHDKNHDNPKPSSLK